MTTLTKRHVSVRGTRVTFRFATKGRARVRTTLVDDELADALRDLLELPGHGRVFRYRRTGELAPLTAPQLNEYLREHMGAEFSAKDFRTWGGTLAAAVALAEHGPVQTEAETKTVIATVMRRVGERLGNTPAVARASYVAPAVLDSYAEGLTLEHFRPRALRIVRARSWPRSRGGGPALAPPFRTVVVSQPRIRSREPETRKPLKATAFGGRLASRPRGVAGPTKPRAAEALPRASAEQARRLRGR